MGGLKSKPAVGDHVVLKRDLQNNGGEKFKKGTEMVILDGRPGFVLRTLVDPIMTIRGVSSRCFVLVTRR